MDAPTFLRLFDEALRRYEAAPASATSLLGQRVAAHGLVTKPELNGHRGIASSYDEVSGRLSVLLDGCAQPVALKPANVTRLAPPPSEPHSTPPSRQPQKLSMC